MQSYTCQQQKDELELFSWALVENQLGNGRNLHRLLPDYLIQAWQALKKYRKMLSPSSFWQPNVFLSLNFDGHHNCKEKWNSCISVFHTK